jgi:hypothetical protein
VAGELGDPDPGASASTFRKSGQSTLAPNGTGPRKIPEVRRQPSPPDRRCPGRLQRFFYSDRVDVRLEALEFLRKYLGDALECLAQFHQRSPSKIAP